MEELPEGKLKEQMPVLIRNNTRAGVWRTTTEGWQQWYKEQQEIYNNQK